MRQLRVELFITVAVASLAQASSPAPLDSPSDRAAFRRWFTFLAESRHYARKTAREVPDSASLIRWSFQQALVDHDSAWARATELPILPYMPSVRRPAALNAAFASRALPPSHFVSREISDALPGDILRFRNTGAAASFMIYIGQSQIVPSPARWVVYLAGPPRDGQSVTVHRLRLETLLTDPCVEWRPASSNPDFLGVWRLDILGDDVEPSRLATVAPVPNP